jgi:glycosyltransferase involved in cell wall biosynthesis
MPDLLVFSRNLLTVSGGAELSLINLINNSSDEYNKIILCSIGEINSDINLPSNCITKSIGKEVPIISKLPYLEYFVFRNRIRNAIAEIINKEGITDTWSQNLWAPMINHNKLTVYLRDESALGLRPIYMKGWRYFLSLGVRVIESVFFKLYQYELKKMYENAYQIISNSKWMSNNLFEIFGKESRVVYPNIEAENLISLYNNGNKTSSDIVMIGGEYVKGIDVFLEIANRYLDESFVIYSKHIINAPLPANVSQERWCKDRSAPYRRAKIVLVPSIWQEAFGRVAAECKALGVSVIVSNKGGLPEAVNYDFKSIAVDIADFERKVGELL